MLLLLMVLFTTTCTTTTTTTTTTAAAAAATTAAAAAADKDNTKNECRSRALPSLAYRLYFYLLYVAKFCQLSSRTVEIVISLKLKNCLL